MTVQCKRGSRQNWRKVSAKLARVELLQQENNNITVTFSYQLCLNVPRKCLSSNMAKSITCRKLNGIGRTMYCRMLLFGGVRTSFMLQNIHDIIRSTTLTLLSMCPGPVRG